MTDEVHAIVHGLVQGVWFRQFTMTEARRLGVTGWVRNREDGVTVELVAGGERPVLEALLAAVRVGPPDARVSAVDAEWRVVGAEALVGFVVRE